MMDVESYLIAFRIMPWLDEVIIVIFGLIFGSFFTFLFYRLRYNRPIIKGAEAKRSYCPICQTTLQPIDLIPVLSWVMMRGRCRHCGAKIPIRYPLIEMTTALVFLMVYYVV